MKRHGFKKEKTKSWGQVLILLIVCQCLSKSNRITLQYTVYIYTHLFLLGGNGRVGGQSPLFFLSLPPFLTPLNSFLCILLSLLHFIPPHPDTTCTQPTKGEGEQHFIHRSAVSVSPSAPCGPSELMKNNWWSLTLAIVRSGYRLVSVSPSTLIPFLHRARSNACSPFGKCLFVTRLSSVDGGGSRVLHPHKTF